MKLIFSVLLFGLLTVIFSTNSFAQMGLLKETFDSLDEWRPLTFPKIKRHSTYELAKDIEKGSVLKTSSSNSASGLIWKKTFDVFEYPILEWSWKVENVFKKGNGRKKSGDDYPARMYVVFEYGSSTASFWKRTKYNTAKLLYGEYPPDSSINLVWSSRAHSKQFFSSPYADEAKIIPLQSGEEKLGGWLHERVNILELYNKAFGEMPPKKASIAIMNDSDNTGESAISYFDDIELRKE